MAERCLLHDGSVFSDRSFWTKQHISELKTLFVDNPILGNRAIFTTSSTIRSAMSKPEISQLASEAIWLLLSFVYEEYFGVEKKRERISQVWNFSGKPLPKSEYLANDCCLRGLANPGTAFLTKIWAEYGFLLTVMQAWKSLPSSEQSSLPLENPWDLCQWVTNVEGGDVRAFRHMFLYFSYPASFERICSHNHKKKILRGVRGKARG